MKNKLLITTALVALTCGHNAFAENLPADATNLTSGSYVVERSGTQVSHPGDINLSGTASLDVKTQAIVEEEAEEVDVSNILNVVGNVSLADDASLSVINSNATDDTEKPSMTVDGTYAQNGGNLVLKQDNGMGWSATLDTKNAVITDGTIDMNQGALFVYGEAGEDSHFNITGGTFTLKDSNISTYSSHSPEGNALQGAEMNISGGTFKMNNESSLGRENSGDLNISGGEFTLENGSAIFHDGVSGDINISGGTISLKDSSIVRGGNYQSEDYAPANGDINISGGKINVGGSSAEISSAGNINIFNGAEINIASGSTLYAKVSAEDMDQAQKATLRVADNDTRFNIGGTLSANIDGDDRGKIHLQNSNAKIDGNVEGASLIFEDSHTLSKAVTGTVGSLDIFEIQKGTLTYDKELHDSASSVVVGEGATLDIGANELHSGGEKEVEGEGVHFKDNSTLKFTVTDKDTYGKIYANYVNISENGTTLDMSLNSAALSAGDDPLTLKLFNDEDTPVEIEGKFANLTSNSRYDFADNGDGTYTVTANGTTASDIVADAGGTTSNASTAEAWDSVSASDSSPVAAAVAEKLAQLSNSTDSASQKAYVDALTAVAPEVAPMVQKTQTETANQVFSAVSTRLTGGSISTGSQGMSSGDTNPDAAVWVQGMYNHSELDDTSKAKGFDADSAGIAMGIEKNIGRAGKVGAGYAYTNTDIDGFMRSTDVDTHTAIVYGEYKPNNWYINGIATYGWSDYSEDKNVSGQNVKADYDVETLGLQAMTGYEMFRIYTEGRFTLCSYQTGCLYRFC